MILVQDCYHADFSLEIMLVYLKSGLCAECISFRCTGSIEVALIIVYYIPLYKFTTSEACIHQLCRKYLVQLFMYIHNTYMYTS